MLCTAYDDSRGNVESVESLYFQQLMCGIGFHVPPSPMLAWVLHCGTYDTARGMLSATLAEKPWQNCQNLISNLAINRLQWDNINLAAPFDVFEATSVTAIIHETNNCIVGMVCQLSKQFAFSHKTSQLLGQKYPTRPPTHLRKLGATCATRATLAFCSAQASR